MNKKILITINGTDNNSITLPLKELSHTIIFGASGSGKSNLLHMLITNLTKNYSPDKLKLALIDPKYVEFDAYKKLPHIHNGLIKWFAAVPAFLDTCIDKIKYKDKNALLIIIDELAELTFNKDIISKLTYILDKGEKHNIYLIMATQRPDIIPKEIINKTKTQICFPIDSFRLSEDLLEKFELSKRQNQGEMLFINSNTKEYMQTAYIKPSTIKNAVKNCKKEIPPEKKHWTKFNAFLFRTWSCTRRECMKKRPFTVFCDLVEMVGFEPTSKKRNYTPSTCASLFWNPCLKLETNKIILNQPIKSRITLHRHQSHSSHKVWQQFKACGQR